MLPLGRVRTGLVPTPLSCSEQPSPARRLPSAHKRTDLRTWVASSPEGIEVISKSWHCGWSWWQGEGFCHAVGETLSFWRKAALLLRGANFGCGGGFHGGLNLRALSGRTLWQIRALGPSFDLSKASVGRLASRIQKSQRPRAETTKR